MPQLLLFHYGPFQPLWQQAGPFLQCGPQMDLAGPGLHVGEPSVAAIKRALLHRGLPGHGVLLHYTDPFLIRSAGLRGLNHWLGPKLLVCGDLHHGPAPLETLAAYQGQEPHDGVLLTFNPMLLAAVQERLAVPVTCQPPGFFRYPTLSQHPNPVPRLIHVGRIGPHHPHRRQLVEALVQRQRIPFLHTTTDTPEQAADLYNASALVLNVPLNNDLNHRFFEVIAAGSRQVVFGSSRLLGEQQSLGERSDVHWAETIEQLETVVQELLANPKLLHQPAPPLPCLDLKQLLALCWAP